MRHRIEGLHYPAAPVTRPERAGEFVDYREYASGEDLRRLDWKVLARTGRAYIRLCQDETTPICTLVLDASDSMRMGASAASRDGHGSAQYVQLVASPLSHLIGAQQDQVGLSNT